MVRCKIPGGVLTARQYLVLDELAGRYGNGTLRVTTRQDNQFHGVVKGDLKTTIRALNDALVTTRSEEHTSELQSQSNLVCRLLLEKKKHSGSAAPPSLTLDV